MISSPALALALSALYVVTGGYALLRWSSTVAGPLPPARRLSELAHLLMSAAMLVMTWTWSGSAGLWVQILLFGGFAAWFAVDAARRHRLRVHGCAGGSAHALMSVAMVWMLAAMPLIMASPVAAASGGGGHSGHAGHTGDAAVGHEMHAGPVGWAVAVTVLLCVALLGTAGFWAVRALATRTRGHEADEDVPGVPLGNGNGNGAAATDGADCGCDPAPGTPTGGAPAPGAPASDAPASGAPASGAPASGAPASGAPASGAPSTGTAPAAATAVAERPAPVRATRLGARTDAACHALMSVGAVVMLAAMVAGW